VIRAGSSKCGVPAENAKNAGCADVRFDRVAGVNFPAHVDDHGRAVWLRVNDLNEARGCSANVASFFAAERSPVWNVVSRRSSVGGDALLVSDVDAQQCARTHQRRFGSSRCETMWPIATLKSAPPRTAHRRKRSLVDRPRLGPRRPETLRGRRWCRRRHLHRFRECRERKLLIEHYRLTGNEPDALHGFRFRNPTAQM
jgi:hypothetical protein